MLVETIIGFIAGLVGPPESKHRSPWVQALMDVGCGLVVLVLSLGAF